ncbi:hypothetical protein DMB66_15965 [Actinoplanes sp. ATCC 53533]|uniref:hypothetical protein n=1 Tax=Actinoplanes sp. ATCC 53533 TaxID=1288362 RepID=UPI000F78D5B3|nr:hypothetical protein [Actinoplanes sp. ATCC 53533]RSM67448.1 hypothetical protein DMB66_15965 [Actinoplanes sp. ATCC 53533]
MTFDEHAGSSAHRALVRPDAPSAGMRTGPDSMRRRRLLMAAAVALTVIAGVTGAHAASAAASKPDRKKPQPAASGSEEDLWRRQDQLSALCDWIDAQPGIKTSGYVTSINDPEVGSTVLVWHGPPDRMQQQIMDEARRRNIPISIQQRNHSMNDLERAVDQLIAIKSGTGEFQNFKVSTVATFDINFDGVTVQGDYIHPPAEGVQVADTALAQTLAAKTGVAVAIEHGQIQLL